MGQRIRQLEDALAIFQAGVSTETHPLLRDELLGVKFGPEVRLSGEPEPQHDPVTESMDAFGTLTIGNDGEAKYFGRSAGSEVRVCLILLDLSLTNGMAPEDSSTGEIVHRLVKDACCIFTCQNRLALN